MMELQLTQQVATSHWGWTIAFFLWLVGLSGMSLALNFLLRSKRIIYAATFAGVVGTLLVVSHLARLTNLPFAVINALSDGKLNFGSWMFIGICILSVLCIATVLESLALYVGEKSGKTCPVMTGESVAWFNMILGVAATAYSGFLLTQASGVPLWNTSLLPVLWVLSGLGCAFGLVEILEGTKKLDVANPTWLTTGANVTHIAEAFVLFSFVQVAFAGTPGEVAGAVALVSGHAAQLFWGGAVAVGIVVPIFASKFLKGLESCAVASGLCSILGASFCSAIRGLFRSDNHVIVTDDCGRGGFGP